MYDTLSLTYSALLNADMILSLKKKPVPNSLFSFPFPQNVYSPAPSVPPSSSATYTPTKSKYHFDSSFDSVTSEPAHYKVLTYHIPNLMSIFHHFGRLSKESV
jgi:hypothetical protein